MFTIIINMCQKYKIHFTNITTGCVYQTNFDYAFKDDIPKFIGSNSIAKGFY